MIIMVMFMAIFLGDLFVMSNESVPNMYIPVYFISIEIQK